jgi:hypothetical protein
MRREWPAALSFAHVPLLSLLPKHHNIDTHVPGDYYTAADSAYVFSEKNLRTALPATRDRMITTLPKIQVQSGGGVYTRRASSSAESDGDGGGDDGSGDDGDGGSDGNDGDGDDGGDGNGDSDGDDILADGDSARLDRATCGRRASHRSGGAADRGA